jgi:serine kinase of HPr protein (carbohydrate metabolism regulator)
MLRLHGTCVEVDGVGVLLRGPSGAGKSDLALRLIDAGAFLVADDQVRLRRADGRLQASGVPAIAGFLEVRGMGAIAVPARATAALGLVVDLVAPDEIERWPEPSAAALLGVTVPSLKLAPFEPSACAKLRLAAREAEAGRLGVIAPRLSRAAR